MKQQKVKPNTETMSILFDIFGEERGRQIVEELNKESS
jgi:hypothetical protein